MIVKQRSIPIKIFMEEALLSRLPKTHPKWQNVYNDRRRRINGLKGENSLDYEFSFLPDKGLLIFHGLRLPHNEYYFQIDTLILSTRFAFIVEIKNYSGTLVFDKASNQMTRIMNEKEDGFANPILQVKRQKKQFNNWLDDHNLPSIPTEYLVEISNPATIIKSGDKEVFLKVCKSVELEDRFNSISRSYEKEVLNEKGMRKLKKLMLKEHTPHIPDILEVFGIQKNDLVTGVQCPSCLAFSMKRQLKNWNCPRCLFHSKDAHIQAIMDYFLIFGSNLTNRMLREFLHISLIKTASNMLTSMKFPYTGKKKGRVYHPPPDFDSLLDSRVNPAITKNNRGINTSAGT
ncbi:nuclease-related domain-containing protein [Bacillus sp. T33-2]|uniref:nuclease-related domain-containing protein n=1 Tax=Bacillus sp. T33-2 TaxID=2054168 RepID=UPI0015E071B9|nr:nuclease-related domain-containing protein [Bacillus sp. T33-2]